ncbi:MAG: HPF/RaiA family ribosome-associated protein [Patescibacteria group bacterium]
MRIQLIGDDAKIDDHIRSLVDEKLAPKLDQLLQDFDEEIKTAKLRVKDHPEGYEVSLEMWLPGKEHIFAKTVSDRLTLAITEVREQVEKQLERYRGELMPQR